MKRLILIFFAAIAANAQQNALLLPWTPQQFTNTNGTVLANGKVCTYQAGTSTGLATYTDSTASVANSVPPNAILLDSTGRPTSGGIWLKSPLAYKIVVLTAGSDSTCNTGVTIKSQDQVITGSGAGLNLNNTFTGTNTFTGPIQPKTLANVVYVQNSNPQGWAGATPDAWIVSAAGSGSIVIDARGLTGNQAFTGTVALPADTTIYFGLVTITCNTSPCFSYNNQVAIFGAGDNSTVFQGPNPNGLGGPLIAPANSANRTFDAIFRDFYLDNRNNATGSGVCIDYSNMSRARTYNVGCANAQNAYKVGGTIGGFYNEFMSTWCLNAGTNCFNITANGNSARLYGGHSNGSGTNCITIDGATDVRIQGFDAEQCTTGFNIAPTTATSGTGIQHVRLDTSITTGFNISANASRTYVAGVYPAGVTTLLVDNATDTVFIVAHGDGHSPNFDVNKVRFGSTTTEFALLYCQSAGNLCFFRNPADSGDAQIRISSATISGNTGIQLLEGTPAGGAGGQETCQGSSTAHQILCSLNGSAFGPLVTAAPCTTSQRTESAADANLLTCAIPAQAGSYRVRFIMDISAANAATLGWTATWTDSNGTAAAPANLPVQALGAATTALTVTTSVAGEIYGYADISVNNSATSIVVKTTFSGTSFTAKASATVERII